MGQHTALTSYQSMRASESKKTKSHSTTANYNPLENQYADTKIIPLWDGCGMSFHTASRRSQPPLALSVPLSRFTSRVGGGSAFFVRRLRITMSDYAKTALEVLKLAPRYLVSLGIIAALFLFLPDKSLKWFGIFDFAQHYRPWFSVVFISTSVLFGVDRAIAIRGWIRHKKAVTDFSQARLERLHRLTEDEKQILRFYFAKQTRSNILRIDDGGVQGLVSAGIIYRSAQLGNMVEGFAHNISDFAWDYFHQHPELLDGTTNLYRTDRRDIFHNY